MFTKTVLNFDPELNKLLLFVEQLTSVNAKDFRILDVGCGYGRILRPLAQRGYDVLGVETNSEIVSVNRSAGLPCKLQGELTKDSPLFDLLIMSHVIEHFVPSELLPFIDSYLDRLKIGGHLLIATPLLTPYFYDDFDHVKPYQPFGITMVFGNKGNAQVQYYSRNKLVIENLWYRRGYYRFSHSKSRHIRSPATTFMKLLELGSATLTYVSRARIGKLDGWVGVFRKVS